MVVSIAFALRRLVRMPQVVLWLVTWVTFSAAAQPVVPMNAVQISPSVWYVEGVSALGSTANQNFISNAAFVVTSAGVVVIDVRAYTDWLLSSEKIRGAVREDYRDFDDWSAKYPRDKTVVLYCA